MIPTIYIFKYDYRSCILGTEESSAQDYSITSVSSESLVSVITVNNKTYDVLSYSKNPQDSNN